MNRFRPNIVLAGGGAAWSDDGWQGLNIGSSSGGAGGEGTVLQYVKPCSRCKVSSRRLTVNSAVCETLCCRQPGCSKGARSCVVVTATALVEYTNKGIESS
jgi:hypothetical protein